MISAFHHPLEGFVVVAVKLVGVKAFGPLIDQGVEIVGLLEVEVILAVLRV